MNTRNIIIGNIIEAYNDNYLIVNANNGYIEAVSFFNKKKNSYLRHRYGTLIESNPDLSNSLFCDDSSFVPELGTQGVMFRCTNSGMTGLYLINDNKEIIIGDKNKATNFNIIRKLSINEDINFNGVRYVLTEANNGKLDCVSMFNERTGRFLRHKNGKLEETLPNAEDKYYIDDSSFNIKLEDGEYTIYCTNPGLEDHYISISDKHEPIISKEGVKFFIVAKNKYLLSDTKTQKEISEIDLRTSRNERTLTSIDTNLKEHIKLLNESILQNQMLEEMLYVQFKNNILKNFQRTDHVRISVIVPVFNMEQYIPDALNSIVNQTLSDLEVIAIDDGSTDESYKVLYEYAVKDKRIKLIHQENKGVGISRNIGIKQAQGEFICFLDPDDMYPSDDVLEKLYVYCKSYGVQIAGGEFSTFSNDGKELVQDFKSAYDGYLFACTRVRDYKDYQFDYGFHRFIYSRELVLQNDIRFPSYKRFQDPPFMVQAMHIAKKFVGVDMKTYAYRINHKEIGWNPEKINDFTQGMKDVLKIALDNNHYKLQMYSFYHLADHVKNIKYYCDLENKRRLIDLMCMFDIETINNNSNDIKFGDLLKEILNLDVGSEQPYVTVVMPIYNASEFLDKSLESVKNQTLRNIEIICVNDGSKDNSLRIINKYAESDSRFVIIDKPNSGYGHSMNQGIDAARGEFLGILEPDDYIDYNMYLELYYTAKKFGTDFVKSDFYYWYSGENRKVYYPCVRDSNLYDAVQTELQNPKLSVSTVANWSGIYKMEMIKKYNVRHLETPGASYQDQGFYYRVLFYSKNAYYVNKAYYYYRQDNANSSVNSKNKIYCIVNEYDKIEKELNNLPEKEKFYNLIFSKKFNSYQWNYQRMDEEFKDTFLAKFKDEFQTAYESGKLKRYMFSFDQWNKLVNIIDTTTKNVSSPLNHISVAFAIDNNYYPYCMITIQSMLHNKDCNTFYDIYIMIDNKFKEEHKNSLYELSQQYSRNNINFIEMGDLCNSASLTIKHTSISTYYRLYLPELLKGKCDKCFYFDSDIIINCDLSKLYNTDLNDSYVAGVVAAGYILDKNNRRYYQSIGISNLNKYINAGMTLWNIEKINNDKKNIELIKCLDSCYKSQDQDIINLVLDKRTILDLTYNCMTKYDFRRKEIKDIYGNARIEQALDDPQIIHYADKSKPWHTSKIKLFKYWLYYKKHNSFLASERMLINIKNHASPTSYIEIIDISDNESFVDMPSWYKNNEGEGVVIESYRNNLSLLLRCSEKGNFQLILRGADLKNNQEQRINQNIEYTSLLVNNEEVLHNKIIVSHDTPYKYFLNVEKDQVVDLKISFSKIKSR